MTVIKIQPLTAKDFAPYGNVIEISDDVSSFDINNGTTQRYHDQATVTISGGNARPIISMARSHPFTLPLSFSSMERHPDGSQSFIPVVPTRFLVVVATTDENGKPGTPKAFMASKGQGINYTQNIWHGGLTALDEITDFIIVDRAGDGANNEVFEFNTAFQIEE